MALTNQPKPINVANTLGLASGPVLTCAEKASATFVKGSLVQDDDAGRIDVTTSPVDGSAVGKRTIGIALMAASGTTGTAIPVAWAGSSTVFEATLSNSNAGTHVLAQADVFQTFPITKATTNWYLDTNNASTSTNTVVADGGIVVGLKDPIGTVDGRVYFIVTNAARGPKHASSGAI